MGMPERLTATSRDLPGLLGELIVSEVRSQVEKRGACGIALTGGSLGTQLFPALAKLEKAKNLAGKSPTLWSQVHIFWGDERAVPRDHPDSNFKQAHELWLKDSAIPKENIHPMDPVVGLLESNADAYEKSLRSFLGSTSGLDLVLLGVGPDGHICSLFPEHPLLQEPSRWVAPVTDSPKPPSNRLTLTLPALFAAQLVIVAATGNAKAKVIHESQERTSQTPLAQVLRGCPRVLLALDEAASRG